MKLIPVDAKRTDWPRLVAGAVNGMTGFGGRLDVLEAISGWGAYVNTAGTQTLSAATKVSLTNNAGTTVLVQHPADVAALYSAGKITGREGDAIGVTIELTFTPSSGVASNLYLAIDIGGSIGEIYPRDFAILKGSGVAHKVSYSTMAYTLDTWEANGGTVKIEVDGPGDVTGVRYVIHRLHKARA